MQSVGSTSLSYSTTFLIDILTIPEIMFLAFVKDSIQSNLDQKNDLIYFGASEYMQSSFSDWTEKTFTCRKFTEEELNLITLITSIWTKTKNYIENDLQDSEAIQDEEQCQKIADEAAEEFSANGSVGKMFTARQATYLLKATESI
jgi:hypothetical protein